MLGCSAGPDGIRPEHLKYAMDDSFTLQLSILLSLCVAGGVVPDGFCVGILIPVLKKSNIDPKNHSPITVSSVLSKLLELYILEQCENYEFAESQYGYIRGRGTDLATVMAHDISEYCVAQGSAVYMCSLDVEGAYDALPHAILLLKAMKVLPDASWNILYFWYTNMSVRITWNNIVGNLLL